jgi:MiaB/RimO family radical SAM methylthiotransferase
MRFAFYTLGCKVNQYETQAMEQFLLEQGHSIGSFQEPCDGYIVNTCSVTAVADRKNRTVIRRCRRENPNAVLAVCGCYPQHDAKALWDLGADVVGGSGSREDFIRAVLDAAADRQPRQVLDKALARRSFEVLPAGGLEERTRAMLKVQDGCCNFCTYCIIPYTRGPVRSAPLELVVEQAKALAQKGYREIVVTGIEIASWGVDLPGKPGLGVLLEAVCRAVPQLRVRLGSLEPRIITEDFCRTLALLPNLCPHFHLSMQSGCDTVLQRMKRKYDSARYLESVQLLTDKLLPVSFGHFLRYSDGGLAPGILDGVGVLTGQLVRRCAGATGIGENMHFRKAAGLNKLQTLGKFLLGFSGEGNDHVGGDGAAGEIPAQQKHTFQIPGRIVLALHALQHRVAAGLHGQVELRTQIWKFT